MLSFLFDFLFDLIMLAVMFCVTSGAALIFRKIAFKGKEGGMYHIWLAVIFFALIPVRIGEPRFILFAEDQSAFTADMPALKLSELLKHKNSAPDLDFFENTQKSETAVKNTPAAEPVKNGVPKNGFDIIKSAEKNKETITICVLALWLLGFTSVVSRAFYGYFKMKKLFYRESDISENEKINSIFKECKNTAGLKKDIGLRILKHSFISPCVCGLINPIVFIDAECENLDGEKLKYIFMHELYHIKRYDIVYKFLSAIAAGAHWFNPLAYKVVKTIGEDCELSIDKKVVDTFGDDRGYCYMNVILDVAEKKCSVKNGAQPIKIPSASLFFGEKHNIEFLNRRYMNMKNITNKKRIIIALSVFLTVITAVNITVISSCAITGTAAAANYENTSETVNNYADQNVYEAALRLYFGLLPGEEITQEDLAKITDIKIIRGIKTNGTMTSSIGNLPFENFTPVSFIINQKEIAMIPGIMHKRVFDEFIQEKIAGLDNQRTLQKLNAYFAIKDPSDPSLTTEEIEEMRGTYPIAFEYPIAVFDINASDREYLHILSFFAEAGLIDDCFIQNGEIDAGYLGKLPNLQNAEFCNITANNLELLSDKIKAAQYEIPYYYIDQDNNN